MPLSSKKFLLACTALIAFQPFAPVCAATVTVNGGNQNVNSDPAATPAISFLTDNTATVADGVNITGTVITSSIYQGTLTLAGSTTVTGDVGTPGTPLLQINVGAAGSNSIFEGTANAAVILFGDTGSATFEDDISGAGALSFTANGTAYLTYGHAMDGVMEGPEGGPAAGNVVIQGANSSAFTVGGAIVWLNSLVLQGVGSTVDVGGPVSGNDLVDLGGNTLNVTGFFSGSGINAVITNASGGVLTGGVIHGNAGGFNIPSSASIHIATTTNDIHIGDTYTVADFTPLGEACFDDGCTIGTGIVPVSPGLTFTQITTDPNALVFQVSSVSLAAPTFNNTPLFYLADLPLRVLDITSDVLMAVHNGNAVPGSLSSGETGMSAGYASEDVIDSNLPRGYSAASRDHSPIVNTTNVWVQTYGQHTTQGMRDGFAGYSATAVGGSIGMDTLSLIKDSILGGAVNFTSVNLDSKANMTADINSSGVILYGGHDLSHDVFMRGQAGYSHSAISTRRYNSDGLGGRSQADYNADQYYSKALLGQDYLTGNGTLLTPNLVADYVGLHTHGYTETGSSAANLDVASETFNQLRAGPGVDVSWKIQNSTGDTFLPLVRFLYEYDILGNRANTAAVPVVGGSQFTVAGPSPARHIFLLGGQATYATVAGWDMSARYDFTYKDNYHSHDGLIRATLHF